MTEYCSALKLQTLMRGTLRQGGEALGCINTGEGTTKSSGPRAIFLDFAALHSIS